MIRTGRICAAAVVAMFFVILAAPPALADAPGPTDYRSEIIAIEPATDLIELEMIGGDSFVRMTVAPGHEVVVLGYRGEPYLNFAADGTVSENRRSPATWLNQERYGTEDLPSFADHEAPPQWVTVADEGVWAWHDHRTHWMNEARPPGAQAGDQVLEAAVPLLVDGEAVTVSVASWLLGSPSPAVPAVAAALGLAGGLRLWNRSRQAQTWSIAAAAAIALGLGLTAWLAVPAETGPDPFLWVLPTAALVSAGLVSVLRNRLATTVYLDGLMVAGGGALAFWALRRVAALWRALIPTDAPAALDRFVIAAVLTLGLVLAARGLLGLARPQRLPADP